MYTTLGTQHVRYVQGPTHGNDVIKDNLLFLSVNVHIHTYTLIMLEWREIEGHLSLQPCQMLDPRHTAHIISTS